MVDIVGEVAFYKHIARKELALGIDLAAAPDLHDLLGRNEDFLELVERPRCAACSLIDSATFFSKFE